MLLSRTGQDCKEASEAVQLSLRSADGGAVQDSEHDVKQV